MKCPKCSFDFSIGGETYDPRHGCPVCGWMRSPNSAPPEPEGEFAVSSRELIVCWILALVFVLGSYVAVRRINTAWAVDAFPWAYYCIGGGIYLLIAFILSPNPDIDQPIYWQIFWPYPAPGEWRWNGTVALMVFILAPGKIVLAALWGVPCFLIECVRSRAKNRAQHPEKRSRISTTDRGRF